MFSSSTSYYLQSCTFLSGFSKLHTKKETEHGIINLLSILGSICITLKATFAQVADDAEYFDNRPQGNVQALNELLPRRHQ